MTVPRWFWGAKSLTIIHLTEGSRYRQGCSSSAPTPQHHQSSCPLSSLPSPHRPLTWLLIASLEVGRASRQKGRRQDHWGVKVRGRGAGDLITLPPLPSHPASPIPTPPTSDFSLQVKPGRWVNRITYRLCNFLLLVFALSFQCLRGMPICSPKPPHSTGDTAHSQLGQQGGRWE